MSETVQAKQPTKLKTTGTIPMTEYSISQNYLTDTHYDPQNWSLLCTHHPAPTGGKWYRTTKLENAQIRPVQLSSGR